MQFYIKDTSSLNFPLTCSYESTTFKCELTTESDINLLTTSSYGLYLENSKIQDITINSVKGICLEKCRSDNDQNLDYNDECVSKCPDNTGNINLLNLLLFILSLCAFEI